MFAADVLWFWALGASLASAVLSTLFQSWVRRYVVVTQVQQNPRCRALIRAYVIHEKSTRTLQLAVDFLHLLLDFSIFFFLLGILGLLPPSASSSELSVDPAQSNFSLIFVAFPLFAWYIFLFLISFRRHTIYSTPLSRVVSHIGEYLKLILLFPFSLFKSLIGRKHNAFIGFDWVTLDRVDQVAGKISKALPSSLDGEIVEWLLGSLYYDKDFEQFLESIPGFYHSDHVKNAREILKPFHQDQVPHAIMSFMFRTLSSSAATSNEIKQKRIRLSLDVMELDLHLHQRTFSESYLLSATSKLTTSEYVDDLISDVLVDKANGHPDTVSANGDPDVRLLANCITAIAISRLTAAPQTLDDHWSSIIERRLRFQISAPAPVEQLASMKLVNLVRFVEDLRSANLKRRDKTVSQTLLTLTARDFQASNAGHQYKVQFCNLWNELQDSAARDRRSNASLTILPKIQIIYNALHEGTNDALVTSNQTPAYYPRCTTHAHHPKPPLTPGPSSTGSW